MKGMYVLLVLFLLSIFSINTLAGEEDSLFVSVNSAVLVFDRVLASNQLAAWAEENGGYFTWKSEEQVRIRVPDETVKSFRSFIEGLGEFVLQYDQSSLDLREELMHSRSALEAREEILAKNLSYLSSSDMEGTLELEREIRRLMNEIDSYRGRLRLLENNRKMALIDVALSFQNQSVPDSRPSSFEWINSMDFYGFMNEYMMDGRNTGFGTAPIPLPEGFALIDKSPDFLAISPEGVRLRVRKVKNYPEQSIAFWSETLDKELSKRGYIPVEASLPEDWGNDKAFESKLWVLPWGN
ncbi:MAG: DUF4349 domain-containing protein, partial [Spirochaetaceae bacterium]|nr:DUF4349 domain-containing protein [Spirochaetaceae bacterium]